MSKRVCLAMVATMAALWVGTAWGEEEGSGPIGDIALQPNVGAPGAAPVQRGALMDLFDRISLADPLERARVRVYGHVEGSYTYNLQNPQAPLGLDNLGRVFDIEHNEWVWNQITLNVERLLDPASRDFDFGGRIEMMYGGDARFIHANGLLDDDSFFDGPSDQFDLTQAYIDVGIPLARQLRIRAGKFAYFKQLDPNASVFYSHSFTFGGALPFTLTGLTAGYPITDALYLEGGVVRGWDQALEDNNNAPSYVARLRYAFSDRTSLTATGITGPEQADNSRDLRSAVDVTLSHQLTDRLLLLADAVAGQGSNESFSAIVPGTGSVTHSGDALYYGLSGYAIYTLNPYIAPALRLEWFRDEDGLATGAAQSLYEITVGFTLTPFPHDTLGKNLKIRPEVRYDYSDELFFDTFTSHDQVTLAIDAIFNY